MYLVTSHISKAEKLEKSRKKRARFQYRLSEPMILAVEGQITDFFWYTSLEITKKSPTKITKSQRNHIQKASKITNH